MMKKRLAVLMVVFFMIGCGTIAHSDKIGANRYNVRGVGGSPPFGPGAEENFIAEAKRVCPNGFKILERRESGRHNDVIGSIECD
jgi:hypothetical protein